MSNSCKRQVLTVTLLFVFAWHSASLAQSAPMIETQVVMLGTGTPLPDPQISGDTSPTDAIVDNCHGCDILISEAYTKASFALVSSKWQRYRLAFHTSAQELGAIAAKATPGLLILYHRGNAGCDQVGTEEYRDAGSEEQLLREIRQAYGGKAVAGMTLMFSEQNLPRRRAR
jgi:hypothetical protein